MTIIPATPGDFLYLIFCDEEEPVVERLPVKAWIIRENVEAEPVCVSGVPDNAELAFPLPDGSVFVKDHVTYPSIEEAATATYKRLNKVEG